MFYYYFLDEGYIIKLYFDWACVFVDCNVSQLFFFFMALWVVYYLFFFFFGYCDELFVEDCYVSNLEYYFKIFEYVDQ